MGFPYTYRSLILMRVWYGCQRGPHQKNGANPIKNINPALRVWYVFYWEIPQKCIGFPLKIHIRPLFKPTTSDETHFSTEAWFRTGTGIFFSWSRARIVWNQIFPCPCFLDVEYSCIYSSVLRIEERGAVMYQMGKSTFESLTGASHSAEPSANWPLPVLASR